MIVASLWLLGSVVLAGIGLSSFYLIERPIRGWVRLASLAHGLSGAAGVALVVIAVRRATQDRQGFGQLSAVLLAITLLGGLLILAAQLRRRRPAGLVVALHAIMGVTGTVILAAYAAIGG